MSPRTRQSESAQALVEFALAAPVLLLVVFALMSMGHTFGKQLDLKSATRDGARRGAVSAELAGATAITRQGVLDSLSLTDDADVTIVIAPSPPWEHGDSLTVTSSTPHAMRVLGVPIWSGNLEARSRIRVE